ncbi:MAG: OmpA family protein [Dichotomicrobium sp.]
MQTRSAEFDQLKELLLKDEHYTLQRLEALVQQHQQRVGDSAALRSSVAEIVCDALRDAEKKQHWELETTVSPLVVGSIRRELRNSRDEMVEAFYPILGRLVSSYVASRFKQFVEALDERLGNRLSGRTLLLRLKSLRTGVPYKALLLREAYNFTILEVSLIQRKSGIVIDHWRAPDHEMDDSEESSDTLFGGLVAAINEFATDALRSDDNALRSFETPDSRIYLRASSAHILAVRTRGRSDARIERILDKTLIEIVESEIVAGRDGGSEIAPQPRASSRLPEAAERLTDAVAGHKRTPVLGIAAVVTLTLAGAGFAAWHFTTPSPEAVAKRQVQEIVSRQSELAGFPIQVEPAADRMVISGLVPSEDAKRALQDAVAAASPAFEPSWQLRAIGDGPVLEEIAELRGAMEQLATRASVQALATRLDAELRGIEARVAALQTETATLASRQSVETLQERYGAVAHDLGDLKDRLTTEIARLDRQGDRFASSDELAALSDRFDTLSGQIDNPEAKLASWVQSNAIFFSQDAQLRDTRFTGVQLDELARLLKQSTSSLRIVGYTDPSGSGQRNRTIAAARALTVEEALIARGVPENRLKTVGRSQGPLLSADKGRTSSNRRVEFEILYRNEPAQTTGEPLEPEADPVGNDRR